ncbi:MAG: cell envelope integrity protein TolA [Patescibacteria group bacterium]|nr:cell envelope integrity protein TolA [Patescibacteria group bacterium]
MKLKLLVKGLVILLACAALSVLLWVFSQLLGIYWVYGVFLGVAISAFGLDIVFSRMIAALLTILTLLSLPWIISFLLLGKRKALVLTVGVMLIIGGTFAVYYGSADVFFDRETGKSVKYYIKTMDGFRFSNSADYDPRFGIKYKAITPEVVKEFYFWEKTGKMQNMPNVTRGKYFDQVTGEPIVWYAERPDGTRELFPLPGHDPLTGKNLKSMTAEIAEAMVKAEKEQEAKREEEKKAQIEAQLKEKEREQALSEKQKIEEEKKLRKEKIREEKVLREEQKPKENPAEAQRKEQKHLAEIKALKQKIEEKEAEANALKVEKLRREQKNRDAEAKAHSLPKRQIIKFDMDSYSKANFFSEPLYVHITVSMGTSAKNSRKTKQTNYGPVGGSTNSGGGYNETLKNSNFRTVLTFYVRKLYTVSNLTIAVIGAENYAGLSQTIKFHSVKLADELGREHEAVCIYNISTGEYNDNTLSFGMGEEKMIALIFPQSKLRKLFFKINWCDNSILNCQDVYGTSMPALTPGSFYSPQELTPAESRPSFLIRKSTIPGVHKSPVINLP